MLVIFHPRMHNMMSDRISDWIPSLMKENRAFGKNPICDCSRSNVMPYTDKITEIAPYARTYF